MMSKPHFLKSATSFCASLMMISMIVSSIHCACASQPSPPSPSALALGLVGRWPPAPPPSPRMQRATCASLRLPARHDALIHPGAGDLVDADEHRLAGLPARRAVLDEIGGDLVEPVVGGDDLVVLAEQLLEQRRLIRVEFGLLDLRRRCGR